MDTIPTQSTSSSSGNSVEQNAIATPFMRALDVQGAEGALAARLYCGNDAVSMAPRLIVFFPCGGFARCELDGIDRFMTALSSRTGCHVLASTYTPASVQPFPAAVEDAHTVLSWASTHRDQLQWSGAELIVAGVEAGGNLAAASALIARDRTGPALRAQLLMMPMLDPSLTSCSMREKVSGDDMRTAHACALGYRHYLPHAVDRAHPYASPLYTSRLKGLPPALILTAENDPLRDEAEQYGERLNAAGVTTLMRRLPPFPLSQPDARYSELHEQLAVQEIAMFLSGLGPVPPSR